MIASAPCTQGRPWIYGKACYRQLPSILRMLRTLGTTRKRRTVGVVIFQKRCLSTYVRYWTTDAQ